MTSDDVLNRLGEYFENESIKYLESMEEEVKSIEIPNQLDDKLKEITERYMKEND